MVVQAMRSREPRWMGRQEEQGAPWMGGLVALIPLQAAYRQVDQLERCLPGRGTVPPQLLMTDASYRCGAGPQPVEATSAARNK